MGTSEEPVKEELQILFHALCDGLRQEVLQRHLAHLVTEKDFSLIGEREVGIASSLALHLRSVGFAVQIDAYFPGGDRRRRPDFGIWLPASREYIYLELKLTAWGSNWSYYYQGAINDIEKLDRDTNPLNQRNGLIALGFSSNPEKRPNQLKDGFKKLSRRITGVYPQYEEIGLERVDLEGMDERSSYAMIGLWFRKSLN
jgi:hypothetical protein